MDFPCATARHTGFRRYDEPWRDAVLIYQQTQMELSMTSIDERVTKILDENPNIVEKFPDIFPVFAQKIAPTIEFLETKNISCRFMFAHAFGEGWSISAMLPLGNQETLVVSQSTKQQTFTLKEQGFPITEANTPETLLQYIQMRLASPSL